MADSNPARPRGMSLDQIRQSVAAHPDQMDGDSRFNRLLVGRYRDELFGKADGRVLDVACGVGANLRSLPEPVGYVGIDISPEMLSTAEQRFDELERGESLLEMDAQDLDFEADSFDTVISSLSTCMFPDPDVALREMRHVCKPDGQILLLEHGRSDFGPVARFQDWRADARYEKMGCRWDQEPLEMVSRSDLSIRDATTGVLGMITAIETGPNKS